MSTTMTESQTDTQYNNQNYYSSRDNNFASSPNNKKSQKYNKKINSHKIQNNQTKNSQKKNINIKNNNDDNNYNSIQKKNNNSQTNTYNDIKYHTILDEKDQAYWGYLPVAICVFLWLITCAAPPLTLLFFYLEFYKISLFIFTSFVVCYVPASIYRPMKEWFREGCAKYFKQTTLTVEEGCDILDSKIKTMVPVHPHGIFCLSWTTMFLRKEFERLHYCFSAMLNQGYFRLFVSLMGKTSCVGKKYMTQLMEKGESVALIPGGFEEGSFHTYGLEQTYLKSKFGFVKLALKYGYSLTPVYGFKECFTFHNIKGFDNMKKFCSKWSVPFCLFWGNNLAPMLPQRQHGLHIVIGKSMKLPQIKNPSKEEVQYYHAKYLDEVNNLFERHKSRFYENPNDVKLIII
ncbi:hypothetical protein PPERSA_03481 [Pseudocohnilembus persalinus]|uniref:Acyltransferase n=1 Tax=Pseudocohnilembus persalinus TaxID=266149 RepID=A0A0V0QBW0_PSEPJ|nr:hypothetical protein PPERSA_03481 [Pseudocohnilembus persalinus]|eukprot:KRW99680.1 hypothetical protein PPERSA_03481 [Pseudocohnilembus persalinus]